MNKKLLCLLLSLLLVVSTGILTIISSAETSDTTIEVDGKTYYANVGDVITVVTTLNYDDVISGYKGSLKFDETYLEGLAVGIVSPTPSATPTDAPVVDDPTDAPVVDDPTEAPVVDPTEATPSEATPSDTPVVDPTEAPVVDPTEATPSDASPSDATPSDAIAPVGASSDLNTLFPVVGRFMKFTLKDDPSVEGDAQYNFTFSDPMGFEFSGDKNQLYVIQFKVKKAGTTTITNTTEQLVAGDATMGDSEKLVWDGEALNTEFKMSTDITEVAAGEDPTDAPTDAPVVDDPTDAPTDAPVVDDPTDAPVVDDPTDAPVVDDPTDAPVIDVTTVTPVKPQATTPESDKKPDNTKANYAAVQTGSTEVAVTFFIVILMAAGIVLFARKKASQR